MDIADEFNTFCKNHFGVDLKRKNDDDFPSFEIKEEADDIISVCYYENKEKPRHKYAFTKISDDWLFKNALHLWELSKLPKAKFEELLRTIKGQAYTEFNSYIQ